MCHPTGAPGPLQGTGQGGEQPVGVDGARGRDDGVDSARQGGQDAHKDLLQADG